VKIVRHYHRFGLVDEPRRESSGYRRYGSSDAAREPVQVRTLAEAGILPPTCPRVKRRLTDRIEELVAPRDIPS
jgi:hypothetical protein